MSLFPIFYENNKNEKFFDQKFLKLNFLITDETHLNGSVFDNIKKIFISRKIDNFVIVERYISLTHFFLFFFRTFLVLKKNRFIEKYKF